MAECFSVLSQTGFERIQAIDKQYIVFCLDKNESRCDEPLRLCFMSTIIPTAYFMNVTDHVYQRDKEVDETRK